jgi:hypothetical protein
LNISDYEKRFWQRKAPADATKNVAGYGINSPYRPPLRNHNHLITEWEWFWTLLLGSSELEYFWSYFWYSGNGDSSTGAWYDNAEAVGY